MGRRHSLAVVAGMATLVSAFPLASVFDSFTWMFYAALAIAFVVGTAMLVRTLRGPAWVQVLAMMGALLLFLTWAFPSGGEIARLIPTGETFLNFNRLLQSAGEQVRSQAVPVPDLDGLLLLTTAGVGLVAVLVDLCAVGIRRPALAGLPMLAIYSVPVAVLPGGVSFLSFAFAGAGYLWLLVSDSVDRVRRFGRRFSGDGRDVDVWEPSPLSAAGRRLGVVGLVVAILVPLAIPGMTSGFLDRFGTGPGGTGGDGGPGGPVATVDLKALLHDNLAQSQEFTMVKVKTTDPNPYYLRLGTADQISDDGFTSLLPTSGSAVNRPLPGYAPPSRAGVSVGRYRADVEVVKLDQRLAPLYPQVISMTGLDGNWFLDSSTDQVVSRRPSVNGARYSFDYVRLGYTPQALRTASTIPQTDAGARALTTVPIYSYVTDLVRSLTGGKTNEYDKVRALYDYFTPENGFFYSLSTEAGDSGSDIVDFLTHKRGFCEQYAAALAWLVRSAGYPARVAFGFSKGAGLRDGSYPLTNLNLHAWTEVLFPDFGWVPFDATPASSVPGSTRPPWAPAADQPVTDDPSATPTSGSSAGPAPSLDPSGRNPFDPGGGLAPLDTSSTRSPWIISGVALLVVLLVLLLSPGARRRALRRQRQARTGRLIELGPAPPGLEDLITDPTAVSVARRDAHEAWSELIDTMVDFGIDIDPAETPRATAERLQTMSELAPAGRSQAIMLARAEERARYARSPVRVDALDQAVRVIRASFAERANRTQRLSAMLFPRSVLQRWRLGWYSGYSRAVRRAGRVRDAMYVVSPRRLLTRRT